MFWIGTTALNVTMHLLVLLQPQCTHTQLLLLATACTSVPFSHCFYFLSPPGTDKPCCSGTQGGLLTSSLYNVLQVLKGAGLDWRCGGGAQISTPTTIIY